MLSTTLRNVGGSVMFAIPKALLEGLGLTPNAEVGVSIFEGKLLVDPHPAPHYTLAELLSQCDTNAPAAQLQDWLEDGATGREEI